MNIFVNSDEDRFRAGWRLAAQFFLMYLIGIGLMELISLGSPLTGPILPTAAIASGAVVSIILAARGLDKRSVLNFGLSFTPKSGRQCAVGFMLGGLAMIIIFVIEYTAGWLRITGVGWAHHQLHDPPFPLLLGTYFVFMVIVGFYEELVFRGYQIVNLSEGFNLSRVSRKRAVLGAIALSSLIFGVMHAFNPNASWISTLNVALAGVMLAFPFIITGRLSLSIGLHIGWNFFQGGVFGFSVSGMAERASVLQIQQNGPTVITGGGFGPEAGLLGLLGMLVAISGICWYFKKMHIPLHINSQLGLYHPSPRNYPS